MDKISTLHPKDDLNTNIYPNIVTDNIPSGAVTNVKLADNSVTNSKLADQSITKEKMVNGSVDSDILAVSAVKTENIENLSVTTDKIANSSVTPDKLHPNVTSMFTKHLYSLQFNISDTYVTIFTNHELDTDDLTLNENILLFNDDKTMACTEYTKNVIKSIIPYCFTEIVTLSTDMAGVNQRFQGSAIEVFNGAQTYLAIDFSTFVCRQNFGYEVYLKVEELA